MKYLMILLSFILFWSCSRTIESNPKLISALDDTRLSIRGKIIKFQNNEYRFDYYDLYEPDSHGAYLNELGYQGGGPSWKGIVFGAIKLSEPNLLDEIRFDEEAEGLIIWSNDNETLKKIGRLICVVKSDSIIMQDCIKIAKQSFKME